MSMSSINDSEYNDVYGDVLVHGVVTITTSPVELKVGATPEDLREVVRVYNKSTSTIYIGGASVTTTTGEPLKKNQWIEFPLSSALSLYAVTSSGSLDVIVWEIG